ncbi:hypothetical protein ACI1MP_37480 (plasmid) [Kitasatospora griseola]|uniref:hypothetical protein n=1 Tax=Kitasatospora griseola TaxID=2064 RepID=UPI0038558828
MSVVVVYVPAGFRRNFEIGMDLRVWCWRDETAGRAETPQVLKSLRPGDFVLFGHRGPNARVAAGGWSGASVREFVVTRATSPVYDGVDKVWPDDHYPKRIDLEILDTTGPVSGHQLGTDTMEALRLSANKQGAPVPIHDPAAVDRLADALAGPQATSTTPNAPLPPATTDPIDGDDPQMRFLDLPEDLNRPAMVLRRREQAALRRLLFQSAAEAACDLCGKQLPVRLLRAAHVKRHSVCGRDEQSDRANVMKACVLGCDALFKDGYVYVAADGTIRLGAKTLGSVDLTNAASGLDGRTCTAHSEESAVYFAWHRDIVTNPVTAAAAVPAVTR